MDNLQNSYSSVEKTGKIKKMLVPSVSTIHKYDEWNRSASISWITVDRLERFHSVLRGVLTLNISTIGETSIFRSGWVIRIMPYIHFFPPLSLPFTYYKLYSNLKVFLLFHLIFPVFEKIVTMKWQWGKKVDMRHDSNDPSWPKNRHLPNGRNVEG